MGQRRIQWVHFLCPVLFLDLYAQMEQHFGKSMRKDEALKTESKMGWCSWWTWRHSKTPITLSETYLLAPHLCATGRRTVWSWLSPETWNNRWLGRVAFHISFQKLFATVSLSFLSFQIISYNHIKVGQSGTFVEPGSANLISFSVQIISLGLNLKWHVIIFLQPFWSLFPSQGVWDKYDRQGSGKLWTGRQWKPNWRNQNLLCGTICSSSLYNQVLVKFKSQDNNDRLEFDLEYFNKVLGACLSTC